MNKYTDSQRLKAIWEGASKPESIISRYMETVPAIDDFDVFIAAIDKAIAFKEQTEKTSASADNHLVPINTIVGNDDLAIINPEETQ